MSKQVWHKGPPPHVGWWNASAAMDNSVWRWWNGINWSAHAYSHEPRILAATAANMPAVDDCIKWTTYYPKNARVPRIKP